MPEKRVLKIDLSEMESAMESAFDELSYYLDLETGEIVMVTSEARDEMDALAEMDEDMPGEVDEALADDASPLDWQDEALLDALRVEAGLGTRFIKVPTADSRQGYRDMETFIETISDSRLRERLWRAIGGRGPFRAFKDALLSYPQERERWFGFKGALVRERALDWLESIGVEVVE